MTGARVDQTPLGRDLMATAALAAYSFVIAVGFARVFSGWDFLVDLATLVIIGHGLSLLLRRARLTGWLAIPFTTLVMLWVLVIQQYAATMTRLLPRQATWDQIELELDLVRDQFQTAVAPVLYGAGWATLAGFAMIVVIAMSDSFAFRAEARGEALVPGGVLFVFIAALSSTRLRVVSTMLLLAVGVLVVIALRRLHDRSRRVELSSARRPLSMALPAAVATALMIAVIAGFVGPRLPGAQAEPLYETRGRGGGITEVISPLVDIRSRLTNRGDVELFRVNADAPAYWRATTLPEFDGRTFRLPTRSLERVEGDFAAEPENGRRIRQQIQILSLGGQLVPAAADPFQADGFSDGERIDLRLNRDTNTLVTPDEIATGDLFTVVSAAPVLSADTLRTATSTAPPDPIFLELPDDLPGIVADQATEVTANSTSGYEAAIALQNWFRTEFEYSLEVQSGHGSNAIESFLIERVGYCEQFSATFAAMARTLGLPSRVAVGFTPGILDDTGWYSVLGKNAHAWPELWFDGIGWVAFEPTPGRGAPGAESYTDVPAQQNETPQGAPGGAADPNAVPAPTTPSTVPSPATIPGGGPNTGSPFDDPSLDFGDGTVPTEVGIDDGSRLAPVLLAILALLALVSVMPWAVRWVRARSLRSHGGVERVQRAWARARTAAEQAGVDGRPSMTSREWAQATASQLPVAARPMRSLAELVDQVTYSPPGSIELERTGRYGATLSHDSELWAEQITHIATDELTQMQRIRRHFTTWR
jgi:transglutaminase-like putative cysteine protease